MKAAEKNFLQNAEGWQVSVLLGGLFVILIALFVALAAIARFNQLSSTRCWNAVGSFRSSPRALREDRSECFLTFVGWST